MAQLSAIKAMFHNDAKVLERLDRIETCHESTQHIMTEIFNMLQLVNFSGLQQLPGYREDSGDNKPESSESSCAGNTLCESYCMDDGGRDVHDVSCKTRRDADQISAEGRESSFDPLSLVSGFAYNKSHFDHVGNLGVECNLEGPDISKCNFVDGEDLTDGQVIGTHEQNITDLDMTGSNEKSEKSSGLWESMSAVTSPIPADTNCQVSGWSLQIEVCKLDEADKRTSDESNMIYSPSVSAAHKLVPPGASHYCPNKPSQLKPSFNYDMHFQPPCAQTDAVVSSPARSLHDRNTDKSVVSQLVLLKGSNDNE
jgi:hypothetical protein